MPSLHGTTIGELYIDGRAFCYTLEDEIREVEGRPVSEWKIPGRTAIPFGKYKVEVTYSNRFKEDLPLVMGVPGFSGIRFHAGNTAEDTEGCILVGSWNGGTVIHNSRGALLSLMDMLEITRIAGRETFLEIGRAY